MIGEGVLDAAGPRVQRAYGMHVISGGIPRGQFTTRPGTLMASSDSLRVTVQGTGGGTSAGTSDLNYGVMVFSNNSTISTGGGMVQVTGTGGGAGRGRLRRDAGRRGRGTGPAAAGDDRPRR